MATLRAKLAVFVAILACAFSVAAGDAAPNLDLRDLQGGKHTLADYHGKPVVLNFWATWCVPCAAEMPLLSEMQNRYKDKVLFIAASVDDEDVKPEIAAFIKKQDRKSTRLNSSHSSISYAVFCLKKKKKKNKQKNIK